jgi:hypothetical protein
MAAMGCYQQKILAVASTSGKVSDRINRMGRIQKAILKILCILSKAVSVPATHQMVSTNSLNESSGMKIKCLLVKLKGLKS